MRTGGGTFGWLSMAAITTAVCGCAGAAFDAADGADAGSVDPPGIEPGVDGAQIALPDSGKPGVVGTSTACGPARDAPAFAREVCVTGTTFTMGNSGQNLGGSFADHTPAHTVTLSSHFMDAYEVTVGRYRACVDAGGCTPAQAAGLSTCAYTAAPGANEALPVNCVTWEQARLFCKWDDRRLPTEAEWEFGARGVGDRAYPWGTEKDCERAVLARYAGGPCTGAAGSLAVGTLTSGASPEGIYDLAGNAAEWVADWAGSYSAAAMIDPSGPAGGAVKILRGGSWDNGWSAGLAYARTSMDPAAKGSWGFRCARDAK